jgi:hypothetical protein
VLLPPISSSDDKYSHGSTGSFDYQDPYNNMPRATTGQQYSPIFLNNIQLGGFHVGSSLARALPQSMSMSPDSRSHGFGSSPHSNGSHGIVNSRVDRMTAEEMERELNALIRSQTDPVGKVIANLLLTDLLTH